MKSCVGTVWYMAPEVLKANYTEKCDLWSAGVMLYVMLSAYPPFFGETDSEIKHKILKGKLRFKGKLGVLSHYNQSPYLPL